MKKINVISLLICIILFSTNLNAQIGYHDAAYTRYEANLATLASGAVSTAKSYNQADLQSEATDQICVNLSASLASVEWTVTSAGDGLVVRYSVPNGESSQL